MCFEICRCDLLCLEFAANFFNSEYYPQNIMYDKRVHRGNTFAAMVIPAGTNHDTMIMEKKNT